MAVIDDELSARVAEMLEQFKVVAKTTKCLSARQKRLAVENLLHREFEDSLVDGLFEDYKITSILDEAVRQLQRGITTAKKSRRSPSIKLEDLRDVKVEPMENSGMQGIEATQTKASPTAGLSFTAAAVVLSPGPNAVADSATHAQSYPGPTNVTLRDLLGELQRNLVTQNTLLAALLRALSTLPPQEAPPN